MHVDSALEQMQHLYGLKTPERRLGGRLADLEGPMGTRKVAAHAAHLSGAGPLSLTSVSEARHAFSPGRPGVCPPPHAGDQKDVSIEPTFLVSMC